jgi:hypothetical protein
MGWRVAFSGLGNGVFGGVGIGVYIGWSPLNQLNNFVRKLRYHMEIACEMDKLCFVI